MRYVIRVKELCNKLYTILNIVPVIRIFKYGKIKLALIDGSKPPLSFPIFIKLTSLIHHILSADIMHFPLNDSGKRTVGAA